MKRFSRKERNGAIAVFLVAVALTIAGFCARNRIAPAPASVANERILFQSDTEGEEITDSEESQSESSRKKSHKKHSKKKHSSKKSKKNTPEAQPRDFLKEPIETTNSPE